MNADEVRFVVTGLVEPFTEWMQYSWIESFDNLLKLLRLNRVQCECLDRFCSGRMLRYIVI